MPMYILEGDVAGEKSFNEQDDGSFLEQSGNNVGTFGGFGLALMMHINW